ncbi:DUF4407 domain-containing protein [Arcticibacter sp.]|uniref:DUF4407 domain-containing protein n=1 Tax=Arcticibacter sp. TaxID=1872630 RepID=UPI00388DCAD3
MRDSWLRFGCFLTGYNYKIVRQSSEVSVKAVKKYTSALIIISILWGFIGYLFTTRYLHVGLYGGIIGALILIIVIIQIERQIILSVGKNRWAGGFRVFIGIIMSIIGSVIIDQIIFKDDIEKRQIAYNQQYIDSILPSKTTELKRQIRANDSLIMSKEAERLALQNELTLRPTISLTTSSTNYVVDSLGQVKPATKVNNQTAVPNPKASLLEPLQGQITSYIIRKSKLEGQLITIREYVEREVKSKTGFLDELQLLMSILLESLVALIVWILWFLFLFSIEMFVLVSKFGDQTHDYEETVMHQMNVRLEMLKKLNPKN